MNKKYLIPGIILLVLVTGTTVFFIANGSRINNLALKELCTTSGGEYYSGLKECSWPKGTNTEKKCQEINGRFDKCNSPCRRTWGGMCAAVCEQTCTLK